MSGVSTYGEMAEREQRRVLDEVAKFERLRAPLRALGDYLSRQPDVKVFGGGFD